MTEFTEEKLAELRAVAEAAALDFRWFDSVVIGDLLAGYTGRVEESDASEHIATFDPTTVLALIAALEGLSTTNENLVAYARKAEAALEAKTAEVEGYRQHFPCDGGCSYNDGPQEECSRHGRNPRDLWDIITQLARERDEARAEVDAKADYVSDLEEQVRQRDNHVIPVLHARIKEAERERDEARELAIATERLLTHTRKEREEAREIDERLRLRSNSAMKAIYERAKASTGALTQRRERALASDVIAVLDGNSHDWADHWEARAVNAEAALERVREARAGHPECDKHDDDSPVVCGWKRTVQSIDAALQAIEGAGQ